MRGGGGWKRVHGSAREALPEETGSQQIGGTYGAPRQSSTLLLRKLLQAHLELRQPGQAVEAVRDAAGTPLTPTPIHGRSLESIFGTVEVARTGYGAAGTSSLHPLDGALNLPPEKYSLEVRRRVAIEAAKSSFDEGVKTLEVYTGAHVPKRQFEELVIRAAQDFEAFYAGRQAGAGADPHTGSILVLTVDGKGVVMRPEDLREPTQRAAAARAKTFTARLGSVAGYMPNGWLRIPLKWGTDSGEVGQRRSEATPVTAMISELPHMSQEFCW